MTQSPLKISVLSNGNLLLDGRECALGDLGSALNNAQNTGNAIWYFRENPAGDPPPHAMAVLDLIMNADLPVSMSAQADFSDVVDQSGQSRPRQKKKSIFQFWR